MTASSSVGSTWTTTSVSGSARCDRLLDRVGRGVALPDRGARRDGDHDVGEVAARRRADPQPPQLVTGGSIAGDRLPRRLLGVRRRAVHQHVDVAPHQPDGRAEHERRDEQRRDRVAGRPAGRAAIRPTSTASEPARSLPKCSAFESSAALLKRRAVRSETVVRVTSIASTIPTTTNAHQRGSTSRCDPAGEPRDRQRGDPDADEREHGRLEQRGEVLGLPVPVLVRRVGGPAGDADARRT